jgi:hypothetical protein
MRTRKTTRRRRLYEESEIENVSVADKMTGSTRLSLDSVDDQIDSYIIKFEAEAADAVESEEEMIFEALKRRSLLGFLYEQDESPTDLFTGDPAAPSVDDDAPEPEDSAEMKADLKPAPLVKSAIDIDLFTKKLVRLVMNNKRLLDVESVIINRAMLFLKKNYSQEYVDRMKEVLDTQFDFNMDDQEFMYAPDAPGSAGKPTGGTGGA